MKPIDHLLAATDFSEWSMHAVRRGFLLANQIGAGYTVLHALGLDALAPLRKFLGEDAEAVSARLKQEAQEQLAMLLDDADLNHGIMANAIVAEGRAGAAIPACIESSAAGLVLLGARGQSLLKHMLLGSTTSTLLHKSKTPILVVKQAPQGHYKRVLVGVDFSVGSIAPIRMARAVAPLADMVLLHVYEVPFEGKMRYACVKEDIIYHYQAEAREQALRKLHELAESIGIPRDNYTAVVQHGEPALFVMEQAEHYGCDLISVGKHGAGFTEELLLGSVTRHVLDEAEMDVLVTHE